MVKDQLVGPTGGKHAMEATATFRVAEVRDHILSLGKLVRNGFSFSLGPSGCSMEKDGRKVPLYMERNSLRVEAHVLERASRPGYVAAGTVSRMSSWMVWTSKSLTRRRVLAQLWKQQLKQERHLHLCCKRGRASKRYIPGFVNWEPRFTGRGTCSFDGCANMNRSQAGRGGKRNIWNRGGRSWRWLQNP